MFDTIELDDDEFPQLKPTKLQPTTTTKAQDAEGLQSATTTGGQSRTNRFMKQRELVCHEASVST